MTAQPQEVPIVAEASIPKLIAVFDALYAALADAPILKLVLHDHEGTITKALRMWADVHGLSVKRTALTLPDHTWDCFLVEAGGFGISVHDATSRRAPEQEMNKDKVQP